MPWYPHNHDARYVRLASQLWNTIVDRVDEIVDRTTLDALYAGKATTESHVANLSNPHNTTAAQVGALTEGQGDLLYAEKGATEAATLGMPTIVTSNYTRHLSRYASLAAAVADLPDAGAGGGEIHVDGEVPWTTGTLPPNVHLIGRGSGTTAIISDASPTVPLLDLDAASGAVVAGLSLLTAGGTATGSAYGVRVRGNAADVLIEDVAGAGLVSTVAVRGGDGTVPGTVQRLTLRRVTGNESPSQFGFLIDDCDEVLLDDCHARGNWLDGFKLRKMTRNVTIRGGSGIGNGVGYLTDPGLYAGDGLDAYAGGDSFTIDGFIADLNHGNGLQIKSVVSAGVTTAEFGYVRRFILNNIRARGNLVGSGLSMAVQSPMPQMSEIQISGGEYSENAGAEGTGIRFSGRNGRIIGVTAARNAKQGIYIDSDSFGVTVAACDILANGQAAPATLPGLDIYGDNVRVTGGTRIWGADGPDVVTQADLAALTPTHSTGITVRPSASNVTVDASVDIAYHTLAYPVLVNAGATNVVLHTHRDVNPGAYGSAGSTSRRAGTTDPYTQLWTRLGNADAANPSGNWYRYGQFPALTSLPPASASYDGQIIYYKPDATTAGTLWICRETATAGTYEWKQVTMTMQPALTAPVVTAIDATYDATEQDVIDNLRTRVNELESRLQTLGLLSP